MSQADDIAKKLDRGAYRTMRRAIKAVRRWKRARRAELPPGMFRLP